MNLTEIQKLQLDKLARQNNIRFIVLFGSQLHVPSREGADFDIAVSLKEKKSFQSQIVSGTITSTVNIS
ncbi:MAG: nucleotidyltransferase domain-containing protein [Nitrospirae bacterium]|nr:nucleotidyltransferase domain-containing protein [Nitrospirota bacterium]